MWSSWWEGPEGCEVLLHIFGKVHEMAEVELKDIE